MINLNYTDNTEPKRSPNSITDNVAYVPRTGNRQTGKVSPLGMRDMRKLRENVTHATQNVTASVLTLLEVELNPME